MESTRKNNSDRVGMFLNPHTRNRLNQLKADMSLVTGKIYSQDDVIVLLLNHYAKTAPKQTERMTEFA